MIGLMVLCPTNFVDKNTDKNKARNKRKMLINI